MDSIHVINNVFLKVTSCYFIWHNFILHWFHTLYTTWTWYMNTFHLKIELEVWSRLRARTLIVLDENLICLFKKDLPTALMNQSTTWIKAIFDDLRLKKFLIRQQTTSSHLWSNWKHQNDIKMTSKWHKDYIQWTHEWPKALASSKWPFPKCSMASSWNLQKAYKKTHRILQDFVVSWYQLFM